MRYPLMRLTSCFHVESTGKAGYIEDKWLIEHDAMLDPLCMNGNVSGKYQRKVVAGWHNDDRCERYMVDTAKQRRAAGLIE